MGTHDARVTYGDGMVKRLQEMQGDSLNRILAETLKIARAHGLPFDGTVFVILTLNLPDALGTDYAVIGTIPDQMIDSIPQVLRQMAEVGDSGTRQ